MWIVRDAQGRAMHRARTRSEALAPYNGDAARTLRTGQQKLIERGAWRVLARRGWTVTRDDEAQAA
jgi:hypothetical protein